MKILDITSRLPYPLIDGARICMYQLVQGLYSHGHSVHVVALEEEESDPGPLDQFAQLHVVRISNPPKVIGALKTLARSEPYTQLKRERKDVYDLLDRLHACERFDLVIADQAHVAQYGAYMKRRYGLPYILRCHNVEHEIYRRHTATEKNPFMHWYVGLQADRWARFEQEQMRLADACIAITRRDEDTIRRLAPGVRTLTVPAAVDLQAFPYTDPAQRESNSMIMLGNMGWPPNRNSVLWFTQEILPLVMQRRPDAVCYVVGDNPPLEQLPRPSENMRIEGRVESIAPYYGRIAIGLIPLNVGGGMRVKMVEMMASGMPIVSTGQGAEGNEAVPGEHYVRGDTPEEFAAGVIRLMNDSAERERIARAAREFVAATYSTEQTSLRVEELMHDVTAPNTRRVGA
ncbi:MAG TPA: glycosyltransferase family 4 protein [Candidatus Kapabacteria bacterium]|nr:glycosyltransferase family 4 protein [Candidatus Kapabacteria bacterium]